MFLEEPSCRLDREASWIVLFEFLSEVLSQLLEVEEAEEEEQEDDEIVEAGNQKCLEAPMLQNSAPGFLQLQEFQGESRASWWLERRDPGRSVGGKNKC